MPVVVKVQGGPDRIRGAVFTVPDGVADGLRIADLVVTDAQMLYDRRARRYVRGATVQELPPTHPGYVARPSPNVELRDSTIPEHTPSRPRPPKATVPEKKTRKPRAPRAPRAPRVKAAAAAS